MTETATPKPLNGPLRVRVNKLAHLQGQRHETALRAALTAQVQAARDAGATYEQMAAMVSEFEAGL